jgi:formylglycine-generating enzyme required for sulfatase activity
MRIFRNLFALIVVLLLSVVPAHAADYTDPVTGMEFVFIKGGRFIMGDIYGGDESASPPHQVSIPDFYLGRFEVTFAQYDAFCADTGRAEPQDEGWGRGDRPVINVSWHDAVAFTDWLSEKSDRTFRLPSEAEWEYAARAGTSLPYWWGPEIGRNNANCYGCGSRWDRRMTAPVGSFKPNPWGLYDMQGNVYEWVFDAWHENYEGAPQDGSAWLWGDTDQRVSRGGSFMEIPSSLKNSARNWTSPDGAGDIGFRVLLEAE